MTLNELTNELPPATATKTRGRKSMTQQAKEIVADRKAMRADLAKRIAEPAIPVVQASQVTVKGEMAVVEASTVGLAPGVVPAKIVFLTAAGKPFVFERYSTLEANGEVYGQAYATGKGSKARFLHVLNT